MSKENLHRLIYVAGDLISTSIAVLLFNVFRYHHIPESFEVRSLGEYLSYDPVMLEQLIVPVAMLGIYWTTGYYNEVFLKSRLEELGSTVFSALIGSVVFFFVALIDDLTPDRYESYLSILVLVGLMFGCVYPVRVVITSVITGQIRRGAWRRNTLVVGTTQKAVSMSERITGSGRDMGMNVVGFVSTQSDGSGISDTVGGLPVFGLDDLPEVCVGFNVESFVVIPHQHGLKATVELINRLLPYGRAVLMAPDLYSVLTAQKRISGIVGEPLVDMAHANIKESTKNVKRLIDIVFSGVALAVLSPLMLCLGVLVKLDSPGPVIYKQERIGRHKRPFMLYKFRSMNSDAESDGIPLLSSVSDSRVTRLGHFLRKYRLDELPQFWNVLKGDMSLVGPRPERAYYIEQITRRTPYYTLVQQVRPGLTSLGMVKYGYASNLEGMLERLRYDLLYLENVSILMDLKIMIYTVKTVFTGKGI